MWSNKHKQCFKCETITLPHGGFGFCQKCYKAWYAIEHREELNINKLRYKKRNKLIVSLKENKRVRKNKLRKDYIKTTVYKGIQAEKDALKFLENAERINKKFKQQQPYDLIWNNKKVNVKSASLSNYKFSFGLWGTQINCDLFFFMGYENGKVIKTWLVPTNIFPPEKNSVAFGHKSSKFDKYLFPHS